MRGRKPKPAALKKLTGNPGRRPIGKSKLTPATGIPACPEWLGDEAQRIWTRALTVAPWLATADEIKLACLCQAMADVRLTTELVAKEGITISSAQGGTVQHPANVAKNRAMTIVAKLGSDLGFDPVMRARLTEPEKPETEGDEFFQPAPLRLAR